MDIPRDQIGGAMLSLEEGPVTLGLEGRVGGGPEPQVCPRPRFGSVPGAVLVQALQEVEFCTGHRHAGWLGQPLYLPGQPGSRPLYATTRSTSGALSGTGTGGSKMPLRASRSSGGYMPVIAARHASSVAGSCW